MPLRKKETCSVVGDPWNRKISVDQGNGKVMLCFSPNLQDRGPVEGFGVWGAGGLESIGTMARDLLIYNEWGAV